MSIDEYLPKAQPVPSMHPVVTSSPVNRRPSSSVVVNTSSPVDDCGLYSRVFKEDFRLILFSIGFGMLDFEIIWKESLNVLTITLLRARSLRSCDTNGLSDPYVKLHIVPGVAKVNKSLLFNSLHFGLFPKGN